MVSWLELSVKLTKVFVILQIVEAECANKEQRRKLTECKLKRNMLHLPSTLPLLVKTLNFCQYQVGSGFGNLTRRGLEHECRDLRRKKRKFCACTKNLFIFSGRVYSVVSLNYVNSNRNC